MSEKKKSLSTKMTVKELLRHAKAGEIAAYVFLGDKYRHGIGVKKSPAKARKYYEKAGHNLENDDKIKMFFQGWKHFNGVGVEVDKAKARQYWEDAAEKGQVSAMLALGVMYYQGDGVEEDKAKARQYWEEAADKGDANAMFNLGAMHFEERGKENKAKALDWWEKAAEEDHFKALFNLGVIYFLGDGVEEDKPKARQCLERVAEMGSIEAMISLGLMCLKGDGGEQNAEKARDWWEKAALHFQPTAMLLLGLMYHLGAGVAKDRQRAEPYLQTAARYSPECRRLLDLLCKIEPRKSDAEGDRECILELADCLVDLDDRSKQVLARLDRKRRKELANAAGNNGDGGTDDAAREIGRSEYPGMFAHYTAFKVIQTILPEGADDGEKGAETNRLRLSNIRRVNDPSEGLALADFSQKAQDKNNYYLHEFFPQKIERNPQPGYEDMVYCVAFTEEADTLNLWRFYGDKAQGACLVIPKRCFSFPDSLQEYRLAGVEGFADQFVVGSLNEGFGELRPESEPKTSSAPPAPPPESRPVAMKLRRVFYRGPEKEEMLEKLKPLLKKIYKIKGELAGESVPQPQRRRNANCIDQAVKMALLDVLFLFKNEEYKEEREWRLIEIRPIKSKNVQMDAPEKGRPQFYLETEPFLFEKAADAKKAEHGEKEFQIILGPAIEHAPEKRLEVQWRIDRNDYHDNVSVKLSEIPYE